MISLRRNIMDMMRAAFGRTISNEATVEKIAEHGADTVQKALLEMGHDELMAFTARTRVFIEQEAAKAYRNQIRQLIEADIEKAAQRHLLATLGPRVEALEKVYRPMEFNSPKVKP